VIHCFDAGLAQAQELVDLGHFVSFTGIVTFENASEVREAAKSVSESLNCRTQSRLLWNPQGLQIIF
jgi:Tat protein secretion system quality control protein TatD with DNase activity